MAYSLVPSLFTKMNLALVPYSVVIPFSDRETGDTVNALILLRFEVLNCSISDEYPGWKWKREDVTKTLVMAGHSSNAETQLYSVSNWPKTGGEDVWYTVS